MEKTKLERIVELCQYLSVTPPELYEDKELRWLWYDAIDSFRKHLLKRIKEITWEKHKP